MQTELRWNSIEVAKYDDAIWEKDNGSYKSSKPLLVYRDGKVKKQSLMWVYNETSPNAGAIGLFADDFRPTHYAVIDGLIWG